jgi:hypothetical protein
MDAPGSILDIFLKLDEVLHGALDADPAKRPQTVQQFAAQLRAALASLA